LVRTRPGRSRLRLGQVHGAGPAALDHLRQVSASELVGAARAAPRCALGQQRASEKHMFEASTSPRPRWRPAAAALAAPLGVERQRAPAASQILLVGLLEPLGVVTAPSLHCEPSWSPE
jgi:hypothetical protein